MHWHHAFVCTRTSHDIGCECMVWVDSRFSIDHGKSAPCLVFDKLSWGHGKCDAPFPGGPIDHHQPAETCVSHIMRPINE